jgi:hypothetical protein
MHLGTGNYEMETTLGMHGILYANVLYYVAIEPVYKNVGKYVLVRLAIGDDGQ